MITAAQERAEIIVRLTVTTERLERLAQRLEAYITTPQTPIREQQSVRH